MHEPKSFRPTFKGQKNSKEKNRKERKREEPKVKKRRNCENEKGEAELNCCLTGQAPQKVDFTHETCKYSNKNQLILTKMGKRKL